MKEITYPRIIYYVMEKKGEPEPVPTWDQAMEKARVSQEHFTMFSGGKKPQMTVEKTAQMIIDDVERRFKAGVKLDMKKVAVESQEHEVQVRMEMTKQDGFVKFLGNIPEEVKSDAGH